MRAGRKMIGALCCFSRLNRFVLFVALMLLALALNGCQTGSQIEIPPETQFQTPALGTPVPISAGLSPVTLPNDGSGVLFINNASVQVRVVVSNTIVSIQPKAGFLFVLPSGSHHFYIYGLEPLPQLHTENIEPGKVRYVYLLPPLQ